MISATKNQETIAEGWGTRFRRTIIASPGCRLVKFDYKSFHAAMMGHLANDQTYIRLANIDVHSYVASHMVGRPAELRWSDADLAGYLKEIRRENPEIRDKNAKQAILGWQLGMEGGTLFNNNREVYPKRKDADAAITLINSLFGPCVRYRQEKMMQAHKQGFLLSAYGYLRWFWDVYRTCGTCHWRNRERCNKCKGLGLQIGEEAKEAISHDVQSNSHGHLKDAMLEIHRQGIDEEGRLVNQVHDDLQFDMPNEKQDKLIPQIKGIMEYRNPILEGFSAQVEVKIGPNLADMEEVH